MVRTRPNVAPACTFLSRGIIAQVPRIQHIQEQRLPRYREPLLRVCQVNPACRTSHARLLLPHVSCCLLLFDKKGYFEGTATLFTGSNGVCMSWQTIRPKTSVLGVFLELFLFQWEGRIEKQIWCFNGSYRQTCGGFSPGQAMLPFRTRRALQVKLTELHTVGASQTFAVLSTVSLYVLFAPG